jgi:hypothetical protein
MKPGRSHLLAALVAAALAVGGAWVALAQAAGSEADFTWAPNPPTAGDSVGFTATGGAPAGSTFDWSFGDGTADATGTDLTTVAHTFASSGTRSVTLTVTDPSGTPVPQTNDITVDPPPPPPNGPPTATFDMSDPSPTSGESVTFTSTSTDPDGDPLTYAWDLNGDGQYDEGTGATATRAYGPGVHTVGLQVDDGQGHAATTTKRFTVPDNPPVAHFVDPGTFYIGTPVHFASDSTDADGENLGLTWSIADDPTQAGTGPTFEPTFHDFLPHTVQLTATDPEGQSSTFSATVAATDRPPTTQIVGPTKFPATQPQTFSSSSSDPDGDLNLDTGQQWQVDGTPAGTGRSITLQLAPGPHTISLRATDSQGQFADAVPLAVHADDSPPVAVISHTPAFFNIGDPVTFSGAGSHDPDVGNGDALGYAWDLNGNGTFVATPGPTATRSFGDHQAHTIGLRVTDRFGQSDTTSETIVAGDHSPRAHFTVSPSSFLTGQRVTFTSDSSDADDPSRSLTALWDLNGDGRFGDAKGATASRSFSDTKPHTIALRVADPEGASDEYDLTVTARNRAPSAGFSVSPPHPRTNDVVTFRSQAVDPEGGPLGLSWDLDGDGRCDDATGATARRSWSQPGVRRVKLCVVDDHGATAAATRNVTIANRPPAAAFVYSPKIVHVGDRVTFLSTSRDPDGFLTSQRWDLDGNGAYNNGNGLAVSKVFRGVGDHQVGLRVTDNAGGVANTFETIQVLPRRPGKARLLSPFPIVRIAGFVIRGGVRMKTFTVSGPKGATVRATCSGRHCPIRRWTRLMHRKLIHVRPLERRLRAGITIGIDVTKGGRIGKYTRIKIRAGRPPTRADRCLRVHSTHAMTCPGS